MDEMKDTATKMMKCDGLDVVGSQDTPGKIRAHTRAAWRYVRPAISKTWWWVLLGIAVLMVMWGIGDLWSGTLYSWTNWARDNILKRFPIVPFGLGMLVYHHILKTEGGGKNG